MRCLLCKYRYVCGACVISITLLRLLTKGCNIATATPRACPWVLVSFDRFVNFFSPMNRAGWKLNAIFKHNKRCRNFCCCGDILRFCQPMPLTAIFCFISLLIKFFQNECKFCIHFHKILTFEWFCCCHYFSRFRIQIRVYLFCTSFIFLHFDFFFIRRHHTLPTIVYIAANKISSKKKEGYKEKFLQYGKELLCAVSLCLSDKTILSSFCFVCKTKNNRSCFFETTSG